jgi:hypothetical protein
LIGGLGADILHGGAGDDILIGGTTSYANGSVNLTALAAIMAEWTSANSYATRVANIQNGTGLNNPYKLDSTTVFNDAGAVDQLFGEGDTDWFLVSIGDTNDAVPGEIVTTI